MADNSSGWFNTPEADVGPTSGSAWHMTTEVPEFIGTYEVDRVIARGPHGIVFKATDPLGLKVAIKWLSKRRDEAELDTIVQLSQTVKGMPPILGSGVLEERTYFVMPYFERRSLRFRLRSLTFPQPLPEVIRLARACTEVLGELHRHGYTHFDFKPDNLLIEALPTASEQSEFSLVRMDERLVLTDFGTTRSTDGEEQFGDGTPGYAAPEMLFAIIDHDPRIDVYAASATLVECITGVAPSQVRSGSDSAFSPDILRRTGQLEPVLRKGLSFEPKDRPDAMSQWFSALCDAAEVQQSFSDDRAVPGAEIRAAKSARQVSAVVDPSHARATPRATRPVPPNRPTQSALRRTLRGVGSVAASVCLIVAAYWGLTRAADRPSLIESAQDGGGAPAGADVIDSDEAVDVDVEQSDWQEVEADPPLLIPEPDATWGTLRRRLTAVQYDGDGPGRSDGATYHRIDSSSRLVMSPSERWVLAQREGDWTVVDRSTGDFRTIGIGRWSSPNWHHSEPDTILHLAHEDLALLATTIDGQTRVVSDFRQQILDQLPDAVTLRAPDHGAPSLDGQRFAWAVLNEAGDAIGFVTYDLSTGAVIALKQGLPEGELGRFVSIAMSKTGDRVILAFETAFVVYDLNFADEWRIEQAPYNYELALSASWHDVIVVTNFDTGTFGAGWIVAHNLTERSATRLLNLYDNANTNMNFSGLATDRPGWVLASSHGCSAPGAWSCDRIMALNIDDATIIDIAQTNSCARSGYAVPSGAVNHDFSRAWFNTDYGSCGEDATVVELEIDEFLE